MRTQTGIFAILTVLALSGCSTLGSNVSGDWSCKAVKSGGCRTTHEIDADVLEGDAPVISAMPLLAESLPLASPLARFDDRVSGLAGAEEITPARTADTVGRIVFLPFIDDVGVFHARAVAFAVMRRGIWLTRLEE